jgi:hypothetical protein
VHHELMGQMGSSPIRPRVGLLMHENPIDSSDVPIDAIEYCIEKDYPISDVLQLYCDRYHSDESVSMSSESQNSEQVEV